MDGQQYGIAVRRSGQAEDLEGRSWPESVIGVLHGAIVQTSDALRAEPINHELSTCRRKPGILVNVRSVPQGLPALA